MNYNYYNLRWPLVTFHVSYFIAFHILFYYILLITIYVNFITFYVSYYISRQKVIAFYISITFHVIIAINGSTMLLKCVLIIYDIVLCIMCLTELNAYLLYYVIATFCGLLWIAEPWPNIKGNRCKILN